MIVWDSTSMQTKADRKAQALSAALQADAAAEAAKRSHTRGAAEARERETAELAAWHEAGLAWLKAGEAIHGPNFDFSGELHRIEKDYAQSRRLPFEDLKGIDVNLQAGVRAVFMHGPIIAFVMWFLFLSFNVPTWFCIGITLAYVVWRFQARRDWLTEQIRAAQAKRASFLEA